MIHRFSVSNFRSIRDSVVLDFRIPRTTPSESCFRQSRSKPRTRLPTVVVLVGPNGSGKTALLRALAETVRFVAHSYDQSPTGYFADFIPFLSPETRVAPTRVEVEFDAGWFDFGNGEEANLFRYTLELRRDASTLATASVGYEALHAFPQGRQRRVLERRESGPVYVAKETGIRQRDDRLAAIPANASAISALGKMGVGPFPSLAQDVGNLQTNIFGPDPGRPDTSAVIDFYRNHQELRERVAGKLQRFDLGIEDMQVQLLPDGRWILLFQHQGLDSPVILENESTGTRHLVHVFPQLDYVLQTGHVAVVDALDTEFHTDLSAEVLNWFRREETNPKGAQLICSLHNVSVLDDLEKEELFIVEKDPDGSTRAYGAADVRGQRRGGNLQRQYRSGVLGGLPAFG